MKNMNYIYLSNQAMQGSHQQGWSVNFDGDSRLPSAEHLTSLLDPAVFEGEKLSLLLQDSLLLPLRVVVEEKVGKRELNQYLLWKLKRFLPYPIENVLLRHVPLTDPNTYLTFSLPKSWVHDVFESFRKQGVHCGYLGGLFSTLLEGRPEFKGRLCFCLFADVYLLCEQTTQGVYETFNVRRLPLDTDGGLDLETLVDTDLTPALEQSDRPLTMLNFEPDLEGPFAALVREVQNRAQVEQPALQGGTLERFQACLSQTGVLS